MKVKTFGPRGSVSHVPPSLPNPPLTFTINIEFLDVPPLERSILSGHSGACVVGYLVGWLLDSDPAKKFIGSQKKIRKKTDLAWHMFGPQKKFPSKFFFPKFLVQSLLHT